MTLKPETPEVVEVTGSAAPADAPATAAAEGAVRIPPKPTRAPRRRAPKLDELLAGAVEEARSALAGLAEEDQIGDHVGAVADDDRLVTHRFAATLPGYGGWEWFSTLARAPRSKVITVCEVGLLPGQDAILAPDWVPWSERVSQEEKIRLDAIAAGEDPQKALARFRGETDEEDGAGTAEDGAEADDAGAGTVEGTAAEGIAPESGSPHQDGSEPAVADDGSDEAHVDTGSDAADADAGAAAEAGTEAEAAGSEAADVPRDALSR